MEEERPCSGLISRFNQESALCLLRGLARGSGTRHDFRKITRAGQQQHPEGNSEWDPEEHTIEPSSDTQITITCTCITTGRTGIEMEALSGVSGAALTIYDMCKAVDRGMVMSDIKLLEKSGGKSGEWKAS